MDMFSSNEVGSIEIVKYGTQIEPSRVTRAGIFFSEGRKMASIGNYLSRRRMNSISVIIASSEFEARS